MRLLWLIDSLTLGGAERLAVSFAEEAAGRDLRLSVGCLRELGGNPFEAGLRSLGVDCFNVGARNLRDLPAFLRMRREVRARGIDLVHAHLTYASIWGAVLGRLEGIPLVSTLHVDPTANGTGRARVREDLRLLLARSWDVSLVAVSEAQRRAWVAAGRLERESVRVIPNGVDPAAFEAPDAARVGRVLEELGLEPRWPLVTMVSALRSGKGAEDVLEAAALVLHEEPDTRFLLVGEGPLRAGLEERVRRSGLEGRVVLAGYRDDVPDLLAATDVFVHPSRREALPTAVLEAMAAGLPVVASDVGGVAEILDGGRTGRLVPPGEPEALATALLELLRHSDRAGELGRRARERVTQHYSRRVWVDRLVDFYRETLERRGR